MCILCILCLLKNIKRILSDFLTEQLREIKIFAAKSMASISVTLISMEKKCEFKKIFAICLYYEKYSELNEFLGRIETHLKCE